MRTAVNLRAAVEKVCGTVASEAVSQGYQITSSILPGGRPIGEIRLTTLNGPSTIVIQIPVLSVLENEQAVKVTIKVLATSMGGRLRRNAVIAENEEMSPELLGKHLKEAQNKGEFMLGLPSRR